MCNLFSNVKKRKVEVEFTGEAQTSDAGLLLLKNVDEKMNLLKPVAKCINDTRFEPMVQHSAHQLLVQRVYGLCLGYEDLIDHENLRFDPAWQCAANQVDPLAGDSTLCRFESWANRETAIRIHEQLIEQFISSYSSKPKKLILDFDATDDLVHGNQVGKFFHGYYKNYCFLPLYVYCGNKLLVAYLRPSSKDQALHAGAILKLLVKRLRQEWPEVQIVFRADGGFCRPKILSWCERNDVKYVVGLSGNRRNKMLVEFLVQDVKPKFEETREKQKEFQWILYGAKSWQCERDVVVKVEHNDKGTNIRFVVSNIEGAASDVYQESYCPRGEMENRIKEIQLGLFSDRTSAHEWYTNQFRLLLSALAYVLMEAMREISLSGTELARAQVSTIRNKLLKVSGVIIRNTRRIRFILPSSYPFKDLFMLAAHRLCST